MVRPTCEECHLCIVERDGAWHHLFTTAGTRADMDHVAIKAGTTDHWEWLKRR